MWQTSRGVDDWTDTTWNDIKTLTNQKTLKDNLLDTIQPETPAMTLDMQLAAKVFTNMLILLGKMRGIAGHPLSYVPHSNLKEYAQRREYWLNSESAVDLSWGNRVPETAEYCEKVLHSSARPHIDLVTGGNGTRMHLTSADT
jgi:hypothetical protein